jgi:hypothetical protein
MAEDLAAKIIIMKNMPATGISLSLLSGRTGGTIDDGSQKWIPNNWGYNLGFTTYSILSTN